MFLNHMPNKSAAHLKFPKKLYLDSCSLVRILIDLTSFQQDSACHSWRYVQWLIEQASTAIGSACSQQEMCISMMSTNQQQTFPMLITQFLSFHNLQLTGNNEGHQNHPAMTQCMRKYGVCPLMPLTSKSAHQYHLTMPDLLCRRGRDWTLKRQQLRQQLRPQKLQRNQRRKPGLSHLLW